MSDQTDSQELRFEYNGIPVVCDASNREKIETLLKDMGQIRIGKNVLQDLRKYKTEIHMMNGMSGNADGYYSSSQNTIILSGACSLNRLKGALVHEATHARQNHNGAMELRRLNLNARTKIVLERSMEADAECTALEACNQFAARGDSGPLKSFTECAPDIVHAYNKEKSYTDAFKGWFEQRGLVGLYENHYTGTTVIESVRSKETCEEFDSVPLSRIDRICGFYCDDFADFMRKDKRAISVEPVTKALIEAQNAINLARGGTVDTSIKSIPVRPTDGERDPIPVMMKKELEKSVSSSKYHDSFNQTVYQALTRTLNAVTADACQSPEKPRSYDPQREKLFIYMVAALENGAPRSVLKCCSDLDKQDKQFLQLKAQTMHAPVRDLTPEETQRHRRNIDRIAGGITIDQSFIQRSNIINARHGR